PVEPAAAEPAAPAPVTAAAAEPAEAEVQAPRAADEVVEPAVLQSSLPFGGATPAVEAARTEAPRVEAPRAVEPAPAPAEVVPKQQLEAIVESAGLQWVETTAPAPAVEPEFVPPPRPARKRKPRTVIADEPLQQVET